MKMEKGLIYITTIIILMVLNIYIAYRAISSNVIKEELVWLFFMIIIAILIKYIGNHIEKRAKRENMRFS